ncbi:MAG TPA: hypothetical protein VNJ01_02940 [Bacteriovoracaceae bacterium]|nr:hypothetical protein [Bacteriovoracaceae bacterium]
MSGIRCNADYESELFHGLSSTAVNQSIEFLTFFLDPRPLFTSKKYSTDYLEYVEKVSGMKPTLVTTGAWENWWGPLTDPELEKHLNSKLTSTQLNTDHGWCGNTRILSGPAGLGDFRPDGSVIVKSPSGMSGQKILPFNLENKREIENLLSQGPLVVEPLLQRTHDFSHYVFPDSHHIAYQNIVNGRFQYKGTVFTDHRRPQVENLSFYSEVTEGRWSEFTVALKTIKDFYHRQGPGPGFSVDSFIYREAGELEIRYLSEVNRRKTMGLVCYLLSQRYATEHPFTMLVLSKSHKKKGGLPFLRQQLSKLLQTTSARVLLLSPGDTRFELFFISAEDKLSALRVLRELGDLLPDSEFPVQL